MLAKVNSCAVIGLDGEIIEVEVDISNGVPGSTSSACPTRRCRRRASECALRSRTRATCSRCSASP